MSRTLRGCLGSMFRLSWMSRHSKAMALQRALQAVGGESWIAGLQRRKLRSASSRALQEERKRERASKQQQSRRGQWAWAVRASCCPPRSRAA